jgi:hypothetical protein
MAKKIRLTIFGILLLGLIGTSMSTVYFYTKSKSSLTQKVESVPSSDDLSKDPVKMVEAVSKLILLPAGEEPTIATVSDPSKLIEQPFFTDAKVGDKVLIYQNARKAFLYRPSENRLIEVAPINVGASGTTTTSVDQATTAPTPVKKK